MSFRIEKVPVTASCFLVLAATLGHTQQVESADESPVLQEEVTVRVRLIDFLVVDKKGQPVADLERDEVELWDGGQKQEILDFFPAHQRFERFVGQDANRKDATASPAEPTAIVEASSDAAVEEPPAPRWIVFFFDARNLSYQGRVRSAKAAQDLLENDLAPQDRVALIIDGDELRILAPFSTDHQRVIEYVRDPEGLSTRYRNIESRLNDLRDDTESCRDASDVVRCARSAATNFVFETARETESSLEHLEALLRGLAAIPDRKVLFYFSEGYIENPGDVAAAAVEHAIGQYGYRVSETQLFLQRDYRHRLDRLSQLATRSRTGMYTVNTIRKMTDDIFSPERVFEPGPENLPQARTDPYEATWHQVRRVHTEMAHATGAVPLFRRDPEGLLQEQLSSSAGVYTISYEPSHYSLESRKIRLKVSRGKTRVLYRKRYNYLAGRTKRLIGDLTVSADPVFPSGGSVLAQLEVLGRDFEIAPESKPKVSVASVFFELRDSGHRLIKDLYEVIVFPRSEEDLGSTMLRRPFALRVRPGEYLLRVDVSDVNGPGKGSFFQEFTVEERSSGSSSSRPRP
jgi:VWFA-related protein